MSATTSLQAQQTQPKPGFRKIMNWNSRKSNKKLPQLLYDSAPEGDDSQKSPVPASPTPSLKSFKSGRPSLFAAFARRNSTKSEHSSRSRSPTSPRPSNDFNFASDGIRTPSPTPSRNSMIFERDIEIHDHLSVHEAIDLAIPPVLDDAAEAFVNEEIPTILTETLSDAEEGTSKTDNENLWVETKDAEGRKRLSLIITADIVNNRVPSPGPFDQSSTIAETLRVTTPKEMNGLTGMFDNQWK
ncbi:hypothetical protein Glove_143g14 [Diversispora epigaea]|uniref:Uncharacterized protein n=1 Tax=Diversispora epigaea TaxID=1348612 RepID=A0A397IZ24_9GLOM|nr:hypothetical protein Glove_143g14 [Diversispora epigaea]